MPPSRVLRLLLAAVLGAPAVCGPPFLTASSLFHLATAAPALTLPLTLLPCAAHATCVNRTCVCDAQHAGPRCDVDVRPVPKERFTVPAAGGMFFRHVVQSKGRVSVSLSLDNFTNGIRPPIMYAAITENGEPAPQLPRPQPDDKRIWRIDREGILLRGRKQTVLFSNTSTNNSIYLAVYRRAFSGWLVLNPPPVLVSIVVLECGQKLSARCRHTPTAHAAEWSGSVAVLALPIILGTLALLTIAMCARAWTRVLRRRARLAGAAAHDRLAPAETDAMFPRFHFEKAHAAALGAAGEPACAVCLCGYEEGEDLRRLRCGHSYHADCLDEWLVTNASCPRCRKPARIRVAYANRVAAIRLLVARLLRGRALDDRADNTDDSAAVVQALV